jgi:hypothetical protein
MTSTEVASVWHNDGHSISLELNRANLIITDVKCSDGEECKHQTHGCMVRWFIERYGLECNVGVTPAAPEIDIAWMSAGDMYDLESAQVWIIPVTDDAFAAWLITQQ